jgi:hypothetical protein
LFDLKTGGDGFLQFAFKTGDDGFSRFDLKIGGSLKTLNGDYSPYKG